MAEKLASGAGAIMANVETLEPDHYPACITVDLDAVRNNVRVLRDRAGGAELLAVVKSNGYGMGRTEVAFAALEEGVKWFAVSRIPEALALREDFDGAGIPRAESRILTWIGAPDRGWADAHRHGLDVAVSTISQLEQAIAAAEVVGAEQDGRITPVRIHLNVDVGMSRGGASEKDLPELAQRARRAEEAGLIAVVGLLAHLPEADDPFGPGKARTDQQITRFSGYRDTVLAAGLNPEVCHLGATAAALWHPAARFDMMRPGIGLYGYSPNPEAESSAQLGLRPAARFTTTITQVKQVEPGTKVSYGGTWEADRPTWVGLLPVGYADGIPRSLSNRAEVQVVTSGGTLAAPIIGRVCMDQIMIKLGTGETTAAQVGDEVVLFGDPARAEPSVDQWAEAGRTIHYEILSRLPEHIVRVYADPPEDIDYEFQQQNLGGGA